MWSLCIRLLRRCGGPKIVACDIFLIIWLTNYSGILSGKCTLSAFRFWHCLRFFLHRQLFLTSLHLLFFFNLQPARHHAKSSLPGWQRCLRHLSHSAVRGGAGRLHQGLPGPHLFLSFSARTSTRSTDGAERQWHRLCKLLGIQWFSFRFHFSFASFLFASSFTRSVENKLIKSPR